MVLSLFGNLNKLILSYIEPLLGTANTTRFEAVVDIALEILLECPSGTGGGKSVMDSTQDVAWIEIPYSWFGQSSIGSSRQRFDLHKRFPLFVLPRLFLVPPSHLRREDRRLATGGIVDGVDNR